MAGAILGPFGRHELSSEVVTLKQNNSAATVQVGVSRPRTRSTETMGLLPEQGNWRIALFELPPGQQCASITPGQQ